MASSTDTKLGWGQTTWGGILVLFASMCLLGTDAVAQPEGLAQGEPAAAPEDDDSGSADRIDVTERLSYAENSWLFGDYAEVIGVLNPLLFPEPNAGFTREQLIDAYELLGASFFLETGPATAAESFHELLRLEPDFRLDPFLYPASVVNYLDELRVQYAEELDAIRAGRREPEISEGLRFVERRIEERSIIVSMMPFGIGQFVNDQPAWGYFYLVSEVTLGTISLAMYMTNEASRDAEGWVPDAAVAERRQRLQVGTGIAFFVVLVAGVVHGALIHEDIVQTSYGIIDEPPEDFLEPRNRALRFDGWISDDGWLLGVGGVF